MQEWGVLISAAGLAILVLTTSGGLVWKLSRIEIGLRAEYTKEMAEIRADYLKDVAVLSGKLYQVEIWSRDEFVRKASFEASIARMEAGFSSLRGEITQRLDKMTERIEHIGHAEHR